MTCLITGATGGIGSAIARALSAQNAHLYLVGRNVETLEALNESLSGEHECILADLATESGQQAVIDTVTTNETLSVIVQAAGVSDFRALRDQQPAEIAESLYFNLTVPVLLSNRLVPIIQPREAAAMMFIGSAFGSIGYPGFSSYCAAKFGIRGFAESLQRELRGELLVHYLAPRATNTDFNSTAVTEMNAALGNRVDSPEVVADAALKMLLQKRSARKVIGWPDKIFCRLNGAFPELVDKALGNQKDQILQFAKQAVSTGERP